MHPRLREHGCLRLEVRLFSLLRLLVCSETLAEVRNEIWRKRRAGRLPGSGGHLLKEWWSSHDNWPYPTVSCLHAACSASEGRQRSVAGRHNGGGDRGLSKSDFLLERITFSFLLVCFFAHNPWSSLLRWAFRMGSNCRAQRIQQRSESVSSTIPVLR
jgi:hypothetical protein